MFMITHTAGIKIQYGQPRQTENRRVKLQHAKLKTYVVQLTTQNAGKIS